MELNELLNIVHAIQVIGEVQRKNIAGIFYDSRKAIQNSVFVAIKGYNTDGHKFILDALNKGAIAVVLEDKNAVPDEIFIHEAKAKIVVHNSRIALAELSNYFFKEPSKKLMLVGITGTNGKTTTSYFLKNIFETAGYKTGLMGTIANYIGDKKLESKLTTPESNDLNEMLLAMYYHGCRYAVMEVSSHSLELKRVTNLHFSEAVFTNITSDHLDFHGSFENYFKAKKILFDSLSPESFVICNADDKHGMSIIKDSKAEKFFYGTSSNADILMKNIHYGLQGTSFEIIYKKNSFPVSTSLIGEFNAYNACAAFAASVQIGIDEENALKGIKTAKHVPGRFEVVQNGKKKVIIDYSHTADSLQKALEAVKKINKDKNPIYTVFGCGGNRDKTKRPVMGKIASELSDKVFVTSDNPRFEDPFIIIDEIKKGIAKNNYEIIENREEAIRKSIETSEDTAVILIAGKGHENYQEIKGIRNHFSDKETAEKYLFK